MDGRRRREEAQEGFLMEYRVVSGGETTRAREVRSGQVRTQIPVSGPERQSLEISGVPNKYLP